VKENNILFVQCWQIKGIVTGSPLLWHLTSSQTMGSASPLDYVVAGGVFQARRQGARTGATLQSLVRS